MFAKPVSQLKTRGVTVLGSTGSIGANAVKLLTMHPDRFHVEALTAYENVTLLAMQAKQVRAKHVAVGNAQHYLELKALLSGTNIHITAGEEAIIEAARFPTDIVVAAVVGAAGLVPTLAAIAQGRTVALANKESLVCAGALMMEEVRKRGATLIPVDSEHSAIFQAFDSKQSEAIEKITLTASGGPFRQWTLEQMKRATPQQAVCHPNWNMGAKISVDSATMMNKGLEVIEAYHLFPVKPEQIEVIVHPESIIHGMVSYKDGSVLAQLGAPDMCTPLAHALAWPERMESPSPKLDFSMIKSLTFEQPDLKRFPALKLAREALRAGGSAPVILNAANEVAVERFLKERIGFLDIVRVIENTLARVPNSPLRSIEDVVRIDRQSSKVAEEI